MLFYSRTVRGQVGSPAAIGDYRRWLSRQDSAGMVLQTKTNDFYFPPRDPAAVSAFLASSDTMTGSSRRKRESADYLGGYGVRVWGRESGDEPERNTSSECAGFSGAGGLFLPKAEMRQPRPGAGDVYSFGSIDGRLDQDIPFMFTAAVAYTTLYQPGLSGQFFDNPIGRKYSQSVYIYLRSGSVRISLETYDLFPSPIAGNASIYPMAIVSQRDPSPDAPQGATYTSKLLGLNQPPVGLTTPVRKRISAQGPAQIGVGCDIAAETPDNLKSNKCLLSDDDLENMRQSRMGYDGAFLSETYFGVNETSLYLQVTGRGIWSP